VGRFALLAILAAIALGVFTLIFSESTGNLERFMSGTDTRSGVWERSLSEFRNYPLFGQIPVKTSTELDASESGYLRTLALMGTVGGVLLAGVLAGMAFEIIRAFRAQLQYAELAPICNLVIAGFGTVFVVSIGEGFILGIFTLPVLYIYLLYAASAFIAEYEDLKIIDVADNEGDTDVDGWNAETAPKRF
jgi:O-antigen ligase